MLKGEKVSLRPVRRTDISLFLRWFNDPEVTQYLGLYLPMTEMGEEKWIEESAGSRAGSDVHLVIEALIKDSGMAIGTIGLHQINPKDRTATFGIAIGEKDYWSQGLGTDAARTLIRYGFEQLNLHRINSTVYDFNERSYRMHKKVGFQEEGRRRKAIFKNGQYRDLVEFGFLRDEWL
jgi:RimJ/RimL family protein N-acetyltransferase